MPQSSPFNSYFGDWPVGMSAAVGSNEIEEGIVGQFFQSHLKRGILIGEHLVAEIQN